MKNYSWIIAILAFMVLAGCDPVGQKSPRGFSLPDGNVERGQATFVALKCNACHSMIGIDQLTLDGKPELSVILGGETTRIKTYGELVTSIINPSHRLTKGYPLSLIQKEGKSKMKNYNDIMTVNELIDLVAFLQSRYELKVYEPTNYPHYPL